MMQAPTFPPSTFKPLPRLKPLVVIMAAASGVVACLSLLPQKHIETPARQETPHSVNNAFLRQASALLCPLNDGQPRSLNGQTIKAGDDGLTLLVKRPNGYREAGMLVCDQPS